MVAKGAKIGIGAKKTGFVPLASIAEAYGKRITNLENVGENARNFYMRYMACDELTCLCFDAIQVLVVGGRMQVEIDEITKDKKIILRCIEILEQSKPKPSTTNKKGDTPAAKGKKAAPSFDYEMYEDDEW